MATQIVRNSPTRSSTSAGSPGSKGFRAAGDLRAMSDMIPSSVLSGRRHARRAKKRCHLPQHRGCGVVQPPYRSASWKKRIALSRRATRKEDDMLPARTKVMMAIASGVGVATGVLTYLASRSLPQALLAAGTATGSSAACSASSPAPTLNALLATAITTRITATTASNRRGRESPRRQGCVITTVIPQLLADAGPLSLQRWPVTRARLAFCRSAPPAVPAFSRAFASEHYRGRRPSCGPWSRARRQRLSASLSVQRRPVMRASRPR